MLHVQVTGSTDWGDAGKLQYHSLTAHFPARQAVAELQSNSSRTPSRVGLPKHEDHWAQNLSLRGEPG